MDTVTNMLYLSAQNFHYEQFVTASFSLPITVNKWWNMQNNLNFNWKQVNTFYNSQPVQLAIVSYNINSTQHFNLPHNYSLELTGFYMSASYFGTARLNPIYRLDAGIQKKLANNRDVFRFTANDMFNSGGYFKYAEHLPIQGTTISGDLNFGMVAFKLTFTHTFGKNTLKASRNVSTGAEEELNRVHN